MSQQNLTPGLPVLPIRAGLASGSAAAGLVAFAWFVIASANPTTTFVGALFFAVFFGVAMWLALRRRVGTQRENLNRVSAPVDFSRSRALRLGILLAAVLAATQLVALGSFVWLWGIDSVAPVGGGILLGFSLWVNLEVQDLRRWQDSRGLEMFTSSGARRVAWTGNQARRQAVLVEKGGERTTTSKSRSGPSW